MDYLGTQYPDHFTDTCQAHQYDYVFLLPPWEAIYTQDNERYESFEIATKLYTFLKEGYTAYGYSPIEVPTGSVNERITFIKSNIKLPI